MKKDRFTLSLARSLCTLTLVFASGCKPKPSPEVQTSCLSCHASTDGDLAGHSIEDAHPGKALSCVRCHGGDATALTQEAAHVSLGSGVQSVFEIKQMSSVELDSLALDVIQWVNPSDYRVTQRTCAGSECHDAIVASAPSSIMTTFSGHFNKTRYYAGAQGTREALYGVRDQDDPTFSGEPGTVAQLSTFYPDPLTPDSSLDQFLDHYLEQGCPRCHVWNFGNNSARGDFRSSGCAGCHMEYNNDGLSESDDPVANVDDPAHPITHRLSSAISDRQCEHCHYRGNRIGTMYRGAREQARLGDPESNLDRSVESIHTRAPGFYIFDEDTTNDVDETPPDLHYSAGLGCVDCHMGVDVHGDGKLYSAHDYQVGVECKDCHGTPDQAIKPDAEGRYFTSRGNWMKMLYTSAEGQPVMTGRLSERVHPLVQLADLQRGNNARLSEIHGRYPSGASHLDSLECYTCHTAWTQSCFGCHVSVDARFDGKSLIDGTLNPGIAGGTRSYVSLDYFALGMGTDGKVTLMAPQEKMFVSVIWPCDPAVETCTVSPDSSTPGKLLFDQEVRRTQDNTLGMGFGPVVPHTTSKKSVPCDRCHLREDESNWPILRETFGWGSGRIVIPDGKGVRYDLTQVADEEGNAIVGMAHEGTDVLPRALIDKMLVPRVENSGLSLRSFPEWEAP